jgi:hypothetical protein
MALTSKNGQNLVWPQLVFCERKTQGCVIVYRVKTCNIVRIEAASECSYVLQTIKLVLHPSRIMMELRSIQQQVPRKSMMVPNSSDCRLFLYSFRPGS